MCVLIEGWFYVLLCNVYVCFFSQQLANVLSMFVFFCLFCLRIDFVQLFWWYKCLFWILQFCFSFNFVVVNVECPNLYSVRSGLIELNSLLLTILFSFFFFIRATYWPIYANLKWEKERKMHVDNVVNSWMFNVRWRTCVDW